jgi:hypothetical protein
MPKADRDRVSSSAGLVTTAGLMSAQTVRTLAGSMVPTAMLCSIVLSMRQAPACCA